MFFSFDQISKFFQNKPLTFIFLELKRFLLFSMFFKFFAIDKKFCDFIFFLGKLSKKFPSMDRNEWTRTKFASKLGRFSSILTFYYFHKRPCLLDVRDCYKNFLTEFFFRAVVILSGTSKVWKNGTGQINVCKL